MNNTNALEFQNERLHFGMRGCCCRWLQRSHKVLQLAVDSVLSSLPPGDSWYYLHGSVYEIPEKINCLLKSICCLNIACVRPLLLSGRFRRLVSGLDRLSRGLIFLTTMRVLQAVSTSIWKLREYNHTVHYIQMYDLPFAYSIITTEC